MGKMSEENNDFNPVEESASKSNNRTKVLIGILSVFVVVIVFLIYQNNRINSSRKEKEEALDEAYLQLDSLSNELDDRILTISQLGGEIDTLLKIKEQLETEKKDLLDQEKRRLRTISGLQDKVEGYQELLLAKDEEINQLRNINEQLLSENTELKVETQELNQSIQSINKEKNELNQKVALASRLEVEGMTVYAVRDNGRTKENEFRNRHIDQLKITFSIAENKVAPIEGKELLIRVIAPDGNEIFDVTRGSGTFIFEGREIFYTVKKEILYDRSKQQVEVFYDKGSEYATGQYTVEIYTDDYRMGTGTFIVK